jgi:predicted RNA-binding Zn ribbon-like protein
MATPAQLQQWFRSQAIECGDPVGEMGLRRALEVREALRLLARANNGGRVEDDVVSTLNHALRAGRIEVELDSTGRAALIPTAPGVDGALGALLTIVVDATHDGSWGRLKACGTCRWLFYDYSTNRSARWCSMTLCGNRSKTRAYRGRRRAGDA